MCNPTESFAVGNAPTSRLQSNVYYFELIAEILTGCAFSCNDCYVNRDSDNKVTEKLYRVAYEFMEVYHPYQFLLGSTDVFTARNTKQLLMDIRLRELMAKFQRITINSTLLKPKEEILDLIRSLENPELQVNIVIPKHLVMHEEYLEVVRKNLDLIRSKFDYVAVHPQLNATTAHDIDDYDEINAYYEQKLGLGVEFNPSFARMVRDPQVWREEFLHIRKIMETSAVTKDGSLFKRHLDQARFSDRAERTVFFYDDNYYIAPMLYEEAFQTTETFRIESLDDYHLKMNALFQRQHEFASETEECEDCPNLLACVFRNTLTLMQEHGLKECVLPKKAIMAYNRW